MGLFNKSIVYLVISALFLGVGQFYSKNYVQLPTFINLIKVIIPYIVSTLFWLPALKYGKNLCVVGMVGSILAIFITLLVGVIIFNEKLTGNQVIGIILSIIALILINK